MDIPEFWASIGLEGGKLLFTELVNYVQTKRNRTEFDEKFSNMLLIHNATIHSDKILKFLATEGYLEMTDSYVKATQKLIISAQEKGFFKIGENTRVGTDSSYMQGGKGTSVTGTGKARIDFDDDGITFSV